jgi:hypothetical protein
MLGSNVLVESISYYAFPFIINTPPDEVTDIGLPKR